MHFTCLAVPFPYNITEIALCTKLSWQWRDLRIIEANRQHKGDLPADLPTNRESKLISVGTCSSSTVSQWKYFTASVESLRIEAVAVELGCFISSRIFNDSLVLIECTILGECTIAEADAWKLFLANDLIAFLREGVCILHGLYMAPQCHVYNNHNTCSLGDDWP